MQVQCKKCSAEFDVPKSLSGGVTNCPECKVLVEVGSTPDAWLFWLIVAVVAVFLALISFGGFLLSPYLGAFLFVLSAIGIGVCIACA